MANLIWNHDSHEGRDSRHEVVMDGIQMERDANGNLVLAEYNEDGQGVQKVGRFKRSADAFAALDELETP